MLQLFNQTRSKTLLDSITREVHRCSGIKGTWIFYAMTCYFNQDSIKRIASLLSDELGPNLRGFHLLVDGSEWLRRVLDENEITLEISRITNLNLSQISIKPVFSTTKLFHPKAYALISESLIKDYSEKYPNSDKESSIELFSKVFLQLELAQAKNIYFVIQGPLLSACKSFFQHRNSFLIITSGNLTEAGLEKNIEIGYVCRHAIEISQFRKAFLELQESNSVPLKSFVEKQQKVNSSEKFLSLGVFYHRWEKSIDFRFRLNLSESEIRRLRQQSEEVNAERYGDYKPETRRSLSIDPINIRQFFDEYPKPIPDQLWGSYSIETLLGQWVPSKISELIEEELEYSVEQYLKAINELGVVQKLDEYKKKLFSDVEDLKNRDIIAVDRNNTTAVESWERKIKNICENRLFIKLLVCKYEKINISSAQLDEETLSTLFERVREFHTPFFQYKGVAKLVSELEETDFASLSSQYFDELYLKASQLIESHRIRGLKKIEPDEEFIATCHSEFKIIKGTFKKTSSELISSESVEEPVLIYVDDCNVERELPYRLIRTFRRLT